MSLSLDDLIGRLYEALELKFGSLSDAFESILPDPVIRFNGRRFIPLPSVRLSWIDATWRNVYDKNTLNALAKTNITVDVDDVIGEAIHERLRSRPYQHQVEAIAWSLYTLDALRSWLRGGTPANASIERPFDVVALLAPTASGKTEVLETVAMQIAMDGRRAGFRATKVIMIYPMKEFMKDHIKRLVRDLAYINGRLRRRAELAVTVGLLNEDTIRLSQQPSKDELGSYLQMFFSIDPQARKLTCPLCGAPMSYGLERDAKVSCRDGHDYSFIKFSREAIREDPPDILMTTPDMLNRIMRLKEYRGIFGVDTKGFPLLVIMDEPHVYSGVFGSNVSLLVRDLRALVSKVAKFNTSYEPLTLVSSATIPNPTVFLSKLLVVDPSRIKAIQYQELTLASNKGLIALLPRRLVLSTHSRWGLRNAAIEVIPLVAAILPEDKRRIIVFVDSTERAETLAYQVVDYVSRPSGFWREYKVCDNIGRVFDPSICHGNKPNKSFIRVETLSARIDRNVRRKVAEDFRKGLINVIIATSALEVGVDIGDVDIAILIGLPPTPINFEQRVGRVGRRGQQSLVLVLGDESSGVDVYYLTELGRLLDYVKSARSYDVPINPANPYSIRAYAGNFITSLPWSYGTPQDKLNEYMDVAVDLPCRAFLRTNHLRLLSVARYLQSYKKQLNDQLRGLVQALAQASSRYSSRYIPSFNDDTTWEEVSEKWSNILSKFGLLKVSTPIKSIRTLGMEIPLIFRVGKPGGMGPKTLLFRLRDDVLLAIATYSLSRLPEFERTSGVYKGELHPRKELRGVVTLKPVMLKSKSVRMPFETAGGEFRPFVPLGPQRIEEFQGALLDTIETLKRLENIAQQLYTTSRLKGVLRKKRVRDLVVALEGYVSNVLSKALKSFKEGYIPQYHTLKVVRPDKLIFRPLEPFCFVDSNYELQCCNFVDSIQTLVDAKHRLFCYEVMLHPPQGAGAQYVNKMDFRKVGINSLSVSGEPQYDRSNNDLIVPTPKGSVSYNQEVKKAIGIDVGVVNHVNTHPLILPIMLEVSDVIAEGRSLSGIEIKLETVKLLYANVGYTVSTPISREYSKFIDRRENPAMIGEMIDTYAVEVLIDWPTWLKHAQSAYPALYSDLSQDLAVIGVRSASTQIVDVYALTVAHSLAHILLNFHSLYTGGERRDLGELMLVESGSGSIIKTRILLFDTVMGGNGVSELLYGYLNDIMADALEVMLDRQLKSRRGSDEWFFGEPGDVRLGTWPRCTYGNALLSRLWLLRFLATHNSTSLQDWINRRKQGQRVEFRFP
jgi:ATP-dependent helicase YprA (DUF1998 family)